MSKRSERRDDLFFEALRVDPNVSVAAKAAGYARPTVYVWRRDDPEFAARWNDALEEGVDMLEHEAKRRAVEGVDDPVFHNGAVVGHRRKYSDTLLIFLLKAHRPEKFRDRHEVSGPGGTPLFEGYEQLGREQLADTVKERLAAIARAASRGDAVGGPGGRGSSQD